MINSLVNRAHVALQGEDGGPSVEQIIGISVALIVGTAFILLGTAMNSWIGGAQEQVESLSVGGELGWEG